MPQSFCSYWCFWKVLLKHFWNYLLTPFAVDYKWRTDILSQKGKYESVLANCSFPVLLRVRFISVHHHHLQSFRVHLPAFSGQNHDETEHFNALLLMAALTADILQQIVNIFSFLFWLLLVSQIWKPITASE